MSMFGPRDLEALCKTREDVNSQRQPGLVDVARLRTETLAMKDDPQRPNEHIMRAKYVYLAKSSPTLFKHLVEDEHFPLDQTLKLFDDLQRVERDEISHTTVGENIVKGFMPRGGIKG